MTKRVIRIKNREGEYSLCGDKGEYLLFGEFGLQNSNLTTDIALGQQLEGCSAALE